MLSSRPRIGFDDDGVCNACRWAEKKKEVDWDKRWRDLEHLCDKFRRDDGRWDVVVPCSGGKDGSYVAFKLRDEFHMNPLCVTFAPQLQTAVGRHNLQFFIDSGFDHVTINPNPIVYRKFAKHSFINEGRPAHPFTMGISTAVIRSALAYDIPFIMYGEEGESEYGGSVSQEGVYQIDRDYLVDYYYSGSDPGKYLPIFGSGAFQWWLLPDAGVLEDAGLFATHFSHFENWDSFAHYNYVKEKYDFLTCDQTGTFTDYGQLDCLIHELQVYMMFIKFGFGRCCADACIDIRGGRLSRDEAKFLVSKFDGMYPWENHDDYLNYFQMSEDEFWKVVDSWRGKDVWRCVDGVWERKFEF